MNSENLKIGPKLNAFLGLWLITLGSARITPPNFTTWLAARRVW